MSKKSEKTEKTNGLIQDELKASGESTASSNGDFKTEPGTGDGIEKDGEITDVIDSASKNPVDLEQQNINSKDSDDLEGVLKSVESKEEMIRKASKEIEKSTFKEDNGENAWHPIYRSKNTITEWELTTTAMNVPRGVLIRTKEMSGYRVSAETLFLSGARVVPAEKGLYKIIAN